METFVVIGIVAACAGYLVRIYKKSFKTESPCAGCSCKANSSCGTVMKSVD